MKRLDVYQLENLQGGSWLGCAYGIVSMAVAVGCVATSPVGGWVVAGFALGDAK